MSLWLIFLLALLGSAIVGLMVGFIVAVATGRIR